MCSFFFLQTLVAAMLWMWSVLFRTWWQQVLQAASSRWWIFLHLVLLALCTTCSFLQLLINSSGFDFDTKKIYIIYIVTRISNIDSVFSFANSRTRHGQRSVVRNYSSVTSGKLFFLSQDFLLFFFRLLIYFCVCLFIDHQGHMHGKQVNTDKTLFLSLHVLDKHVLLLYSDTNSV